MLGNRSMPPCSVIPVLEYSHVPDAVDWLCRAFGFSVRLLIAEHRAQLKIGDGCIVVSQGDRSGGPCKCSVMVRVEEIDRHYDRALTFGSRILSVPKDHPYGERQYSAEDLAGHVWTFSESIADVNPEDWGGTAIELWTRRFLLFDTGCFAAVEARCCVARFGMADEQWVTISLGSASSL